MSNIFKKLLEADVVLEPFPHVVIEGLIDRNTYTDLEKQFPSGLSIKNTTTQFKILSRRG